MRIRTTKPEFWSDDVVTAVSPLARLVFLGTWNVADDYGNLDRSARQLKAQLFPHDTLDVEQLILELLGVELLVEYQINGKIFLHIKNFHKHQKIDRPSAPRFPAYTEESRSARRTLPDPSPSGSVPLAESSRNVVEGSTSPRSGKEGKGREGNGRESLGAAPSAAPTRASPPPDAEAGEHPKFRLLRESYPRRAGGQRWPDAEKAVRARLREGHTWQEMAAGVMRYADFCRATGKDGTEYVQQAATFFGTGKGFTEAWAVPATKAEKRLEGSLAAAAEVKRQLMEEAK